MDETMFRDLMQAWLTSLGADQLNLKQVSWSSGGGPGRLLTLKDADLRHLTIQVAGQTATVLDSSGVDEADALRIIAEATSRTLAGDMGGIVVYETELRVATADMRDLEHFLRVMNDQVHIEGSRRLGDAAILDFPEGAIDPSAEPPVIFAPQTTVIATVYAPGPTASSWTERVAGGVTEIAAALCAIATGRPVDFDPPGVHVVDEVQYSAAIHRRMDLDILQLARDGKSLDVFLELPARGDGDAALRARGSALAYHAGLAQKSSDVAVMLFVTAIEALIAPRPSWGRTRVTARFVDAVLDLCPEEVDEMLADDHVREAFDFRARGNHRRQARELLDRVYEARSRPTHAGLEVSTSGILALGSAGGTRMRVLSQLAKAAFLAYLQAPRSSLIGHPTCDSSVVTKSSEADGAATEVASTQNARRPC